MALTSRRRRLATAAARLADLPVIELAGGLCVYEARSWAARRDGLGGLPDLPEDCGLWIAPCRSIHTIGMRFALDLVWLAKDGRVVRVDEDVAPWRFKLCPGARTVIETRAGAGRRFADAWSVRAA